MRNNLLIAATFGTVLSLPAFAQTPPSPNPSRETTTLPIPAAPPGIATQPANGEARAATIVDPAMPATRAFSTHASNILPSNTQSMVAPILPTPPAGDEGSPEQLLRDARNALEQRQTGLAQEALERAETRILSRSVPVGAEATPAQDTVADTLKNARHALGRNDNATAHALVQQALDLINRSAEY